MTSSEFKSELKRLSGGYLFCGEEDYLKIRYRNAVREALGCEGDVFNHIILNEETFSPDALMNAVESLPMMSEKKLIEVSGVSFSDMKESEFESLLSVLSELPKYEYNILLICVGTDELELGTQKSPSKRFAALSGVLKPVVFSRESPARLASWVAKHFSSELIVATPVAVNALLDRCGYDMFTLSSEIDKLCAYLKSQGREHLTEEDVKSIACEYREIGAFDLANAVVECNGEEVFAILSGLKQRKEKPEIVLAGITKSISELLTVKTLYDAGMRDGEISRKTGMFEFKVKRYIKSASKCSAERLNQLIRICYDADAMVKSNRIDSYTVLDRLAAEAIMR